MKRATKELINLLKDGNLPTHKLVELTGFSSGSIRYNAKKLGVQLPKGKKFRDLTNKKINHLTIIERIYKGNGKAFWKCRCECGVELTIASGSLLSRKQISCGCILNEGHTSRADKTGRPSANVTYHQSKSGAIRRGYSFEITLDEFIAVCMQNCTYCGSPPNRIVKAGNAAYPFICNGIDRRDNSIGYVISNCVPCCQICNRAKCDLSLPEWQDWINKIIKFNK